MTKLLELADAVGAVSGRCSLETDRTTCIQAANALRLAAQSAAPLGGKTEPTKEDFAKWSRAWHDTCETIMTLLGLRGGGSPQEMLAEVQAFVVPTPGGWRYRLKGTTAWRYDDPKFNQGVQHVVDMLAKTLEAEGWVAGDGSEDYDNDLEQTLLNILAARGIYNKDDGEIASFKTAPAPRCQKCRTLTHSEEAYVNGQIWCHPCADAAPAPIPPEVSGEIVLIPTADQIEPILEDYFAGFALEARKRCAQRIFDLCVVMSGLPIAKSDNRIANPGNTEP